MTKVESRIGKIEAQDETIYKFLSDFNNFRDLVPMDKISNWESSEDHCSFSINGIGDVGLNIVEKEPFSTIKYGGDSLANVSFNLWIQLKRVDDTDTRVKITLKADLNTMLSMIAKKPLQDFVNILVDKLEEYQF
ncbi:MAG: SRPBCC family protein [Bacteroidales bacterium]|nr:MAG: SRPBCC family protein [Bacteroidales bacterium]